MFTKMFANCLLVTDFQKSLDFYQHKLGLAIKESAPGFTSFKLDNLELAIMDKSSTSELIDSQYLQPGGSIFLCFQVTDLNLAYETLKSKGIKFISPPKTTSWGQTVAYFLDPDNNIWEISRL